MDGLLRYGCALLEQGRNDDALEILSQAIDFAANDDRLWVALGTCCERLGDIESARRYYELGTIAALGSTRCLLALASFLERQQQSEPANTFTKLAEKIESENQTRNETIEANLARYAFAQR